MKKFFVSLITIIIVLVADLVTKHFLSGIEYQNLIPGVVSIATNHGNTGAAFGILQGKTLALVIVSIIMIIALFVYNHFVKNKNVFYCISFGFIIGGAVGNLIDRIFLKYVRDFIYLDFLPNFPIFNLADSFLCIGAVMLAIFILFMQNKTKKREMSVEEKPKNNKDGE